jgi:ubiquinone/menaquinone biosynthesis C-methylase UbiE
MSEYWMDPDKVTRYDQSVELWHAVRREQIDMMAAVLEKRLAEGGTILDLGIGTGQIEEQLLLRIPEARVVGVDSSPLVLERARLRLQRFAGRFELIVHDYHELDSLELSEAPFDATISYDILHHVDDAEKLSILRFLCDRLVTGGTLLFADTVALETSGLDEVYAAVWERMESKASMKTGESAEAYLAHLRERGHHPAPLEAHIEMMRTAGFASACLHQVLDRVLIAGVKV